MKITFGKKNHLFTMFFIGLITFVYIGLSEEYIILSFVISLLYSKKMDSIRISKSKILVTIFLLYYGVSTIIGVLFGFSEPIQLVKYLVMFFMLPYTIKTILTKNKGELITYFCDLKNIIFISSIYGMYEWIFHKNNLYLLMKIPAANWLISMNNNHMGYQPSSIFLHYTYYASFLLLGFVLCCIYPYKSRIINFLFYSFFIIQLFATKSRICWIAFIILLIYFMYRKKILTLKSIKKGSLFVLIIIVISVVACIIIRPVFLLSLWEEIIRRFSILLIYGLRNGSVGQRLGTFMNWPTYFAKYPIIAFFGCGYGSMNNLFLKEFSYFAGYSTADCQYLSVLVETGILGFVIFIMAIIQTLLNKISNSEALSIVVSSTVVIYAIQGITYSFMSYIVILPIILIYVCMTNDFNDKNIKC